MIFSQKKVEEAFFEADLPLSDIPKLDLYMDQILTLLDDTLSKNKRYPEDKLLTKTMINNYSKEKLITPVQGKKYNRGQLIQLLLILELKANLTLADIKKLLSTLLQPEDEHVLEEIYLEYLEKKHQLADMIQETVLSFLSETNPTSPRETLATLLVLSSATSALRRTLEQFVDSIEQTP